MALPEFPIYMNPILDGFQETFTPVVYRTEFETGPAKQRSYQCGSEIVRTMTFTVCGCDKIQEFRKWFVNDISMGALWFRFWDPCELDYVRARIPDHTYSASPKDKSLENWEVTITLEMSVYKDA